MWRSRGHRKCPTQLNYRSESAGKQKLLSRRICSSHRRTARRVRSDRCVALGARRLGRSETLAAIGAKTAVRRVVRTAVGTDEHPLLRRRRRLIPVRILPIAPGRATIGPGTVPISVATSVMSAAISPTKQTVKKWDPTVTLLMNKIGQSKIRSLRCPDNRRPPVLREFGPVRLR